MKYILFSSGDFDNGYKLLLKANGKHFQANQMNIFLLRNMVMIISVICHSKNSIFI